MWPRHVFAFPLKYFSRFNHFSRSNPTQTKVSVYSGDCIKPYLCAHYKSEIPKHHDPSAAIWASLYVLTRSHLYHPFKSPGIQSSCKDLYKALFCLHTTPSVCPESWQPSSIISFPPPKSRHTRVLCISSSLNTSECLDLLQFILTLSCLFSGVIFVYQSSLVTLNLFA